MCVWKEPVDSQGTRTRAVLDLRDVGRNPTRRFARPAGIGRRLLELDPERYLAVCSKAGVDLLPAEARDRLTDRARHSQAVFEQVTLPTIASGWRARVYSHRECGALGDRRCSSTFRRIRRSVGTGSRPPHHATREGAGARPTRVQPAAHEPRAQRARVVTSTRATALDLERRHRLPADRVTVVPLGIDLERFRRARRTDARVPYLFHLSSDDPARAPTVVIDAFARSFADISPVRLVVAGDLGSERGRVGTDCTLGIGDSSTRRGESLTTPRRALPGATATVIASTNEGFGLQPLEAMACGSLLVAARAGNEGSRGKRGRRMDDGRCRTDGRRIRGGVLDPHAPQRATEANRRSRPVLLGRHPQKPRHDPLRDGRSSLGARTRRSARRQVERVT